MAAKASTSGSPGAPRDVFLSYSRQDRPRAEQIITLLESSGFSVWWDGLLEGGDRFSAAIGAALQEARVVVVLWSATSVTSHWVQDEAARGRDGNRLVPVTLDGSHPPLGFGQFETINMSKGSLSRGDPAADRLLKAVAAIAGAAPQTAGPGGRPAPQFPAAVAAPGINRRRVLGGVAVGAAALGVAGVALWRGGIFGAATVPGNRIAVLPFANLGGDPAQTYFSDGLAAEIRSELSRNPLLSVAAQTSSNKFRQSTDDARAISKALNVTYLLDGNVRRSGTTLRVAAELIDGSNGFSKWSQSFDRPVADVFAVQDEIAAAVTKALTAEIDAKASGNGAGRSAAASGGTSSVAAFDAYLRGTDLFDQAIDEASDRAALAAFETALAADADYGLAHAARARVLTVIANQYLLGGDRRGVYAEAITAANRAIAVSPDNAEAHSALGFAIVSGKLDSRAARLPYDRSVALGKGNADVLSRYAVFSARAGNFAAAQTAIARASELDPLNARTFRQVGEVEFAQRRYARSIAPLERALTLNPRMAVAHSALGASLLMLGDVKNAQAAYTAEPNKLFGLVGLAIIAQREGRAADAKAAMATLRADYGDSGLYQQAQVLAQWGDVPGALATLQRALETGDAGLGYLRNDPFLDPLRAEPEFQRLKTRLGFD